MANLADDWNGDEGRQMCIDVLCSYLRMAVAYEPRPPTGNESGAEGEEDARESDALTPEASDYRETRHTILRIIAAHLRPGGDRVSWSGHDFSLRGITIDLDLDFTGTEFTAGKLTLDRAVFSGGKVGFDGADFSGGQIRFDGADFSGGQIGFDGAEFSGSEVAFDGAHFSGGRLNFSRSIWQIPATGLPPHAFGVTPWNGNAQPF